MSIPLHTSIADALAAVPDVGLAILYGSAADGTVTPDSDLDLAVMGTRPLEAGTRTKLIGLLAQRVGRPIDLVDLRHAHGTLLREILRSGRRIVERDPALYPQLLRRFWLDEADFQPYRERILAQRRRSWIGA